MAAVQIGWLLSFIIPTIYSKPHSRSFKIPELGNRDLPRLYNMYMSSLLIPPFNFLFYPPEPWNKEK